VTKHFKTNADYFEQVAEKTSDELAWTSLRMYRALEASNDVRFENTQRHSLTLDLTGTHRHVTDMDGLFEEGPTYPGDVCQIPAGLSARFAWDVNGVHQRSLMVEFDDNIFKLYCPEIASDTFLSGGLVPRNYAPNPALASLISLIARELDNTTRRGHLFAETAIRLLALEIAGCQWSERSGAIRFAESRDIRIYRAIDYIETNFRQNISLTQLSHASGMNITRLINLFKQTTGQTPYAFVVRRRIKHAIELLEKSDIPLAHIAFDVGFSDQQHMSHLFRKILNRTPMSFRPKL
jgi:AraC family transcriptional regulator